MEFEFIAERIENDRKPRSAYADIITKWLESDSKTLKFKCKNANEMRSASNCAYSVRRRKSLDYTVFKKPTKCEVYLVKA